VLCVVLNKRGVGKGQFIQNTDQSASVNLDNDDKNWNAQA